MTRAPLQILVADDHPVVREGICALLDAVEDIHVIGQAATGAAAIAAVDQLNPNLVLLDLQMPDGNGIDAARAIRDTHPEIHIIVLTMFDDDDSVFAAMRAGARGYLLKDADASEVLRAIYAVASGEAIFGPRIAQRVLSYFTTTSPNPAAIPFPDLSSGERAVLDLIATGVNNMTIARALTLSPKTIRNRVSSIFNKLQVADRAEAIVKARAAGLGHSRERLS